MVVGLCFDVFVVVWLCFVVVQLCSCGCLVVILRLRFCDGVVVFLCWCGCVFVSFL